MAEPLGFPPETITTLLTGYTPIQNKKLIKFLSDPFLFFSMASTLIQTIISGKWPDWSSHTNFCPLPNLYSARSPVSDQVTISLKSFLWPLTVRWPPGQAQIPCFTHQAPLSILSAPRPSPAPQAVFSPGCQLCSSSGTSPRLLPQAGTFRTLSRCSATPAHPSGPGSEVISPEKAPVTAPHSQQDPHLTLALLAAVSMSSVPTGEGHIFVVFQLLSCVQLFAAPWTAAHQASLSIAMSQSLLKLMSIGSVMPFNHLILCLPLLLLLSIFPSIRVFSNESALHIRWYWSFSFSISSSSEYSGLISFRMDWLDLLAVQGTLKSLLQHYSSKASILWHSAFFMGPNLTTVHDYWKNHSFDYTNLCWHSFDQG